MTFVYDTCEAMTDVSVALQLPYTQCRLGASCLSCLLLLGCFTLFLSTLHCLFCFEFPHQPVSPTFLASVLPTT